jgi:acetyl/propionyl-CoA carboxylase alpha subunit
MEVNTRIQVENGVSAAIARIRGQGGVDLIAEQIRTALGEPLGYAQSDISFEGIGVEYRVIAEDPEKNFSPWVGRIDAFGWQKEDWLAVYTHIPPGTPYVIPTEFDPNLALGIVWGKDLPQARQRGAAFLDSLVLEGAGASGEKLKSNIGFLRQETARILLFY